MVNLGQSSVVHGSFSGSGVVLRDGLRTGTTRGATGLLWEERATGVREGDHVRASPRAPSPTSGVDPRPGPGFDSGRGWGGSRNGDLGSLFVLTSPSRFL